MINEGIKTLTKIEAGIGKTDEAFVQKLHLILKSKCKINDIRRSSSSDSSDNNVSRRRRDKYSRQKSDSRSREKYTKSRRSRSRSTSTYSSSKSKGSTSNSKEKSRYRSRRTRSRSKSKRRSHRSRSKSYIREYVSKQRRHSSSSTSSSSSDQDRKETKTKILTPNENVKTKNRNSPDCVIVSSEVLDDINEDKFVPKNFSSSKSKKVPENILIDLKKNTIKVPEVEPVEPDSIFHHNLFLNEEARMEKWVKELYSYRQKALQQGLKNTAKI